MVCTLYDLDLICKVTTGSDVLNSDYKHVICIIFARDIYSMLNLYERNI